MKEALVTVFWAALIAATMICAGVLARHDWRLGAGPSRSPNDAARDVLGKLRDASPPVCGEWVQVDPAEFGAYRAVAPSADIATLAFTCAGESMREAMPPPSKLPLTQKQCLDWCQKAHHPPKTADAVPADWCCESRDDSCAWTDGKPQLTALPRAQQNTSAYAWCKPAVKVSAARPSKSKEYDEDDPGSSGYDQCAMMSASEQAARDKWTPTSKSDWWICPPAELVPTAEDAQPLCQDADNVLDDAWMFWPYVPDDQFAKQAECRMVCLPKGLKNVAARHGLLYESNCWKQGCLKPIGGFTKVGIRVYRYACEDHH